MLATTESKTILELTDEWLSSPSVHYTPQTRQQHRHAIELFTKSVRGRYDLSEDLKGTDSPGKRPGGSLRAAINAMCKSCVYHPSNGGTWRQQTEACTVVSWKLYPVRPRSTAR